MPEKDPTNWGHATWILALGMSCAGGLVNFYASDLLALETQINQSGN